MKKFKLIAMIVLVALVIVGTTVVLAQENVPPKTEEENFSNDLDPMILADGNQFKFEQEAQNDIWGASASDSVESKNSSENGLTNEESQIPFEMENGFAVGLEVDPHMPAYAGEEVSLDRSVKSESTSTDGN